MRLRTIFTSTFLCRKDTILKPFFTAILAVFLTLISASAYGQFQAPEFEKVTHENRSQFKQQFHGMKLTGQGLHQETKIDSRQTNEIRARLQAAFGDPTQTLEDLINQKGFRPGKAIQFEYWFTVDDSIPLIILDWDGPFGSGLTFGGASKYVDLMPQIKRAFSQKLMSVDKLGNFQDYFYSPEREQWFKVAYKDGKFKTKKIDSPDGLTIDYSH